MLFFKHGGKTISLQPGEKWTAKPADQTYRDTAAQELWAIIAEMQKGIPWRDAVAARYAKTNPWLHQVVTSPKRDLFFRQHPPAPESRILDVGAGWGQIALPLAKSGHTVTALEPTPERLAFIEAAGRQENCADKMNFLQADIFDLEFETRFDLITCIGVLEWVPKFRSGDPRAVQIDFLKNLRAALAPGGQLVIGIENRLGLKYILGANDDHIAIPNIAVYDASLATEKYRLKTGEDLRSFTFTEAELTELLTTSGFSSAHFHAALPDYKLPEAVIPLENINHHFATAAHLPEHDGCNGTALNIQRELASHYRTLARENAVRPFVASFFITAL